MSFQVFIFLLCFVFAIARSGNGTGSEEASLCIGKACVALLNLSSQQLSSVRDEVLLDCTDLSVKTALDRISVKASVNIRQIHIQHSQLAGNLTLQSLLSQLAVEPDQLTEVDMLNTTPQTVSLLSLHQVRITNCSVAGLQLTGLTKLQHLDLRNNSLAVLPRPPTPSKLHQLQLSGNSSRYSCKDVNSDDC